MRDRDFFRRKAGRRDSNHAAIRDGLRKLGHFVVDTAGVGDGVPDLCVYPRAAWSAIAIALTQPVWLELKAARGKLRESQLAWRGRAAARGLEVRVARTLDEAIEALR